MSDPTKRDPLQRHPALDSPSRRAFLRGAGAVGAISMAEWLGFFRKHGVPGTSKDWGIAKARAQEEEDDRFLVYWFLEGGWDSYSCFSPLHTPSHAGLSIPADTLDPSPPWSQQIYRARNYGTGDHAAPSTVNGIEHGYLAVDGRPLFPDMCVVSSVKGNPFHSGGRWESHYGNYGHSLQGVRQPDERTVMQAFAEAKGANFLLPNISWHRWLSDGELDVGQYPEGTGYYEKLGPAYAHTVYGRTPRDMKARLQSTGDIATQTRRRKIRDYTDNIHNAFLTGRDGASVRAFASALDVHRQLADRGGNFDVESIFDDAALKADFGFRTGDDLTTATVVNGNPARSKESPHVRVQSMMAYELMRAKISCALWIETRDVRFFDNHNGRRGVLDNDGNSDQLTQMRDEVWNPLSVFVAKLKATEMPGAPGVSMYDRTTIVLTSEMGRTISGNVDSILADATLSTSQKYQAILDQDVCQHWHVSAAAFLGGNVNAGTQFGRVGTVTQNHIPMMPDGSLDPAYNPTTGELTGTKSPQSFIADSGHVYATALAVSGVSPTGKGRNQSPPMNFVTRP
jgi:hypothetical protein